MITPKYFAGPAAVATLCFAVPTPGSAIAQPAPETNDWAEVRPLASKHARVIVTTTDQCVIEGSVATVSDDAMIVTSENGTSTIPRQSIVSVVRPGVSHTTAIVTRLSVGVLSGTLCELVGKAFQEGPPSAQQIAQARGRVRHWVGSNVEGETQTANRHLRESLGE